MSIKSSSCASGSSQPAQGTARVPFQRVRRRTVLAFKPTLVSGCRDLYTLFSSPLVIISCAKREKGQRLDLLFVQAHQLIIRMFCSPPTFLFNPPTSHQDLLRQKGIYSHTQTSGFRTELAEASGDAPCSASDFAPHPSPPGDSPAPRAGPAGCFRLTAEKASGEHRCPFRLEIDGYPR